MSSDAPISLTAGLKDVSTKGKSGEKFAIQVESEELMFDPSDKVMAAAVAEEIRRVAVAMLLEGKKPDGSPLPALSPATRRRREAEVAQGQRGGELDERYTDGAFRARGKKNYERDYTAPKSGKRYTPELVDGPRGVVSGMLAESFFARPNRDGKGVTIYVSSKRGKPRKGETLSALQTVYGEGTSLLSKALMSSRSIQKVIGDALRASLISKKTQNALVKLAKSIADAAGDLSEVGEAAEGAAE